MTIRTFVTTFLALKFGSLCLIKKIVSVRRDGSDVRVSLRLERRGRAYLKQSAQRCIFNAIIEHGKANVSQVDVRSSSCEVFYMQRFLKLIWQMFFMHIKNAMQTSMP